MGACKSAGGPWAALVLAVLAGCSGPPPAPRWVPLARGFEPRSLAQQLAEWERAAPAPTGTRLEARPPGMLLERPITAAEWTSAGPGRLAFALPGGALRASGASLRLAGRGQEFRRSPDGRAPGPGELQLTGRRMQLHLAQVARLAPQTVLVLTRPDGSTQELALRSGDWRPGQDPGTFWLDVPGQVALDAPGALRLFAEFTRVEQAEALAPYEYAHDGTRLLLGWPGGEPPTATLRARLENGRVMDGSWQLRSGNHCANGIPVWSGTRVELVCDVPPESQLAFRFVHAAEGGNEPVVVRVRLDGELLLERSLAPGAWSTPTRVVLVLPPAARAAAKLAFEVDGPPGLGAFFTPTLGPRALGQPAARPWPSPPDLVLFLADTFRADGLALHGGEPALAPNLNRFAAQALACAHARASAAWTLPSIASILTGLQPGEHGATDEDRTLPHAHVTLAERLERAGYRTGAITDGSFFSPTFGLDQGFEWFEQHEPEHWDLDGTLASARRFLEEDDGRPVFLVVHTYRVHQPYRVGAGEDRSAYDACMAAAEAALGTDDAAPRARLQRLAPHADELRALYREGVRDLDRGFGELLAFLEGRRFFAHGVLAFTSDHGEALGENQDFFHGGHLWETKLAVPLLLRGAGIAPRVLEPLAGPLDLAPTLAELAGLAPDPQWAGRSLLALAEERPAFAYQLSARSRQAAMLEGSRKVILTPEPARLARGECEQAFDLARDPGEEHDLAAEADWPAELTRRLAPALARTLEPHATEEHAGVSPELRAQLDALGYGGEK